ncbi:SigB/SigF/SigG family RNA polymerase sigma factor [Streptomyces sp. SDT5-1]|uniref:SigB/SigF/SigG family RNA polymerase sigma factor n=1 Tax=Streptomyces sp. SDT5-1 TaxID=3406418 RepID=UPI003FD5A373
MNTETAHQLASDAASRPQRRLIERACVDPGSIAPRDARDVGKYFFERLSRLEEGTREHQYVRNALIEMNLSFVKYAASRFRHRGQEEMEDIIQVGTIGLIKAIDRFELSREVEFTSFALPYITGEIKRFFRDTTWAVHVPRRLQEARVELSKATDELQSRLGRQPTTDELSELMQLEPAEIAEVQKAANGYNAASLDASLTGQEADGEDGRLADVIGVEEDTYELIENYRSLAPLVARLDERDRRIIHLRFVEERTQQEIADALDISQMHVSRLLSRLLTKLRTGLLTTA